MTKTYRDKLLIAIKELNIELPKGKYIKNDDLKLIIMNSLSNNGKVSTPIKKAVKDEPKPKPKIDIKKCCFPKTSKLVAIGDIHGDLSVAIKSLKLANVISLNTSNNITNINNIKWTGGSTIVVQLGDQIDRVRPSKLVNDLCQANDNQLNQDEGSDLKIICLFEKLHEQAIQVGGALFSILGNHELMNVDGDFRYVSPKEFREFGVFFKEEEDKKSDYPYGYKTRKRVFAPGGSLATKLASSRYSILQVGSWVFVHGGMTAAVANDYTMDQINGIIQKWLIGNKSTLLMEHVNKLYHNDDDSYSPFWSRTFSDLDEWNALSEQNFNNTVRILNLKNKREKKTEIKGMIVGHSPQFMYNKGLNSACNHKLWRVDVGMSKAFGMDNLSNRKVQILVIENDNQFKILKEQ
tara:strand:+ start:1917 stop:3140 length:1224 start_codon:yes stop_codon:yes gene_type:complete